MNSQASTASSRFVPPSIDYAKRSARHLQKLLQTHGRGDIKLHVAQRAVARAYAFDDWHALTLWLKRDGVKASLLDEKCPADLVLQRLSAASSAIADVAGLGSEAADAVARLAGLTGAPQSRRQANGAREPSPAAPTPPSDDGFLAWYRTFRPRLYETLLRSTIENSADPGTLDRARDALEGSTGAAVLSELLADFHREQGTWFWDSCIQDYLAETVEDGVWDCPATFALEDQQRFARHVLRDVLKPTRKRVYDLLMRLAIARAVHWWGHHREQATVTTDRVVYAELERILATVWTGTEDEARSAIQKAMQRELPESHNRLISTGEVDPEPTTFFARLASKMIIDFVGMLVEFPFAEAMGAADDDFTWLERAPRRAPTPSTSKPASKQAPFDPSDPAAVKQRIDDLHDELNWWATIQSFMRNRYGVSSVKAAWSEYVSGCADAPKEPTGPLTEGFWSWAAHVWAPSSGAGRGVPPVRAWLDTDGAQCDPLWRQHCESALESSFSVYQVVSVVRGVSHRLRDLLLGTTVDVLESSGSLSCEVGTLLYAQVGSVASAVLSHGCDSQPLPGRLAGAAIPFRRKLGAAAKNPKALRKADATVREFWWSLRESALNPKAPRMVNADGDPLVLHDILYEVRDAPGAFAVLKELDPRPSMHFAEDGSVAVAQIAWTVPASSPTAGPGDGTMQIANFTIEGTRMKVHVNSDRRAEKVKALITSRLGDGATYFESSITTGEGLYAKAREPTPEIEREVAGHAALMAMPAVQDVVSQHLTAHYTRWLDTSIPALDGRTPRAAARSKDGRIAVETLLASIAQGPGVVPGIVAMLRSELRMPAS